MEITTRKDGKVSRFSRIGQLADQIMKLAENDRPVVVALFGAESMSLFAFKVLFYKMMGPLTHERILYKGGAAVECRNLPINIVELPTGLAASYRARMDFMRILKSRREDVVLVGIYVRPKKRQCETLDDWLRFILVDCLAIWPFEHSISGNKSTNSFDRFYLVEGVN